MLYGGLSTFIGVLYSQAWAKNAARTGPCLSVYRIFPCNSVTCVSWGHCWNTVTQQWEVKLSFEHPVVKLRNETVVGIHYYNRGLCWAHCYNSGTRGHCWLTTVISYHVEAMTFVITVVFLIPFEWEGSNSMAPLSCAYQWINLPTSPPMLWH
jgi:hypothetical protein